MLGVWRSPIRLALWGCSATGGVVVSPYSLVLQLLHAVVARFTEVSAARHDLWMPACQRDFVVGDTFGRFVCAFTVTVRTVRTVDLTDRYVVAAVEHVLGGSPGEASLLVDFR